MALSVPPLEVCEVQSVEHRKVSTLCLSRRCSSTLGQEGLAELDAAGGCSAGNTGQLNGFLGA
jgi:hypothetical protein